MTRRREAKALVALCAISFVLVSASCSSGGGQTDESTTGRANDGSTSSGPLPSGSTPAPTPEDLTPTPASDLFNPRSVPWTSAEAVSDKQVRVHFTGGDLRCYGYYATVEETSTTIAITVIEGNVSDTPTPCTDIGLLGTLKVDLEAPVADREIVHG